MCKPYALTHSLHPGNRVGPILTSPEPAWGNRCGKNDFGHLLKPDSQLHSEIAKCSRSRLDQETEHSQGGNTTQNDHMILGNNIPYSLYRMQSPCKLLNITKQTNS